MTTAATGPRRSRQNGAVVPAAGLGDADLTAWLDGHNIRQVRTESVTLEGVVIGKHLSRAKFERSGYKGATLSDFFYGMDITGEFYVGWWDEWRQLHGGDMVQRPDLSTLTLLAHGDGLAGCIADHVDLDGKPLPVCTRSILRRLVERLAGLGYEALVTVEVEAMLFEEPLDVARAKGFRGLTPLAGNTPSLFYTLSRTHVYARFMDEVCRRLDAMGIPWEAWNQEGALGQVEVNLDPADPVTAADWAVRTRQVFREVALDLGHTVTFLAKPLAETYGGGLHVHHSLLQRGRPAFYDERAPDHRTELLRHWIGGLVATMPAAVSLLVPTIASYRRLVDFIAAPTTATWGEENKTAALRVVSRAPNLARVEHRLPSADVNPYVAIATILAGGIAGIENRIEPTPECHVACWGLPPSVPRLPSSITVAADLLEGDERLRELLGPAFVDLWVRTRRWEWLMFNTTGGDVEATDVTDWELRRYFEFV